MEKILNTRQRKAIESLALGNTKRRTAKIAGVTEPTIYNWLKVPEFREELSRAREEVLSIGVTRLTGKIDLAISILAKGAKGKDITADQIRSSNYLLNHSRAFTELTHFGERLEYALEQIEILKGEHETDSNGA